MEYANSLLNLAWLALCLAAFTWFLVFDQAPRRVQPPLGDGPGFGPGPGPGFAVSLRIG